MANKRLGQHFLKNRGALKAIAEALGVEAGDTVFEIGPGHGELTRELLAFGPDKIVVFERDPRLAAGILELDPRLDSRRGDALELLPGAAEEFGEYRLAGNIPYYITGHLFRTLGELSHRPKRAVFVIQKEVAERIAATPPRMNRLAASVQVWAKPRLLFGLRAAEFSPPPEVDSAAILLEPTGETIPENFDLILQGVFAQPRKTVFNNLRSALPEKGEAERILGAAGVDPGLRPQDLSLADLRRISSLLP